jgi:hypothetical protein
MLRHCSRDDLQQYTDGCLTLQQVPAVCALQTMQRAARAGDAAPVCGGRIARHGARCEPWPRLHQHL